MAVKIIEQILKMGNNNKFSYKNIKNCIHFETKGMMYLLSQGWSHSVLRNAPGGAGQPSFQNSSWWLNPNGQMIYLLYLFIRIHNKFW